MRRPHLLPLVVPAAAALTGCAALGLDPPMVGPDYATPETASAERWIDYKDPRVQAEEKDLSAWWTVFADPALDALMAKASSGNLSLRAAAERIAAARARRDLAAGDMFPQEQGASGAAADVTSSGRMANTDGPGYDRNYAEWSAGVGASWEIDFWGRYRRGVESADAALEASVADHDDVMVLLCAEVAARYLSYRTLQERLKYLRENLVIQQASFEIAQSRFSAGAVTERDVHEARQVLEQTKARIPPVERDLRIDANALCVLTGTPPRDLAAELGDKPLPAVPKSVALGIPADLVRRRPDVRRAERIAAAQCALIGVAEADFYPSISLVGTIGYAADHFSDLGESGSRTHYIGPTFQWSLLDWGRTSSNVRAHEADFRAAVVGYQDAVLRAGADVENALSAFLKAHETLVPQGAAVESAKRTVQISRDQYAQGEVDFSTVFLFEGILTEQQDRLAAIRGDTAFALVQLYRALGGGWSEPKPEPAAAGGTENAGGSQP